MLAGIDVEAVLFADQRFLFTGIGIDNAKLCLLISARAMFIEEGLSIRRPPKESRPALERNLEWRGFHVASLAGQNIEDHDFGTGQRFARQRINVVVGFWPELIRRHKLQAGEAARIS